MNILDRTLCKLIDYLAPEPPPKMIDIDRNWGWDNPNINYKEAKSWQELKALSNLK